MNASFTEISSLEKSIVVLPFKNLSGDVSYEYFSDGITEEIINALSKIKGLKVTARSSAFSFKGKPIDIRIIGNELGVTNAVEGSIRIANDRIRVSAQLTRTDTGFLMWSENFDRELGDVFELQDEISLLIADKIRENFGHIDIEESLATIHTQDVNAYQWYLKGRYYQLTWNLPNFAKAIDFYAKSAAIDALYADPVIAIGYCYVILGGWSHIDRTEGLKKADDFLNKGLQMAPNSYVGHFAKATLSFWGHWDFDNGFTYLQNCLQENPYFSEGQEALAELYTANGLFDKALPLTDQMLQINPLSPNHFYTRGNIYYLQGDYKNALSCFENSLKLDPSFALSRHLKIACLLFLKEKKAMLDFAASFLEENILTCIEALYGVFNEGKEILYDAQLFEKEYNLMVHWDFYYLIHSEKTTEKLEQFQLMIKDRIGQIINFQFDPFLAVIRNTNEFQTAVNEIFGNLRFHSLSITPKKSKTTYTFSSKEIQEVEATIETLLHTEKAYLDANLSLRSMAKTLTIHPNKLSKFINDHLKTNFNELINQRRIQHFQEIALDKKNAHLTILGLAYESGFNSKTVFNTYFKKHIGTTPKQWIKQQNQ